MYTLKISAAFDSAHFLQGYNGKCSNIHGHRWLVEAFVADSSLIECGEKRGMVMDFGDVKAKVRAAADSFDHALIFETDSLKPETIKALNAEGFRLIEVPFRPTAENFARHFYELFKKDGLPLKRVAVYETPDNCAFYEEDY